MNQLSSPPTLIPDLQHWSLSQLPPFTYRRRGNEVSFLWYQQIATILSKKNFIYVCKHNERYKKICAKSFFQYFQYLGCESSVNIHTVYRHLAEGGGGLNYAILPWIHLCRPGYTYVALDTLMSPWIHLSSTVQKNSYVLCKYTKVSTKLMYVHVHKCTVCYLRCLLL